MYGLSRDRLNLRQTHYICSSRTTVKLVSRQSRRVSRCQDLDVARIRVSGASIGPGVLGILGIHGMAVGWVDSKVFVVSQIAKGREGPWKMNGVSGSPHAVATRLTRLTEIMTMLRRLFRAASRPHTA